MGGPAGDIEEIEVVVLHGEDVDEVPRPHAPRRRSTSRRRPLQLASAALIVLAVHAGSVDEQPVEPGATPVGRAVDDGGRSADGPKSLCSSLEDPGCRPDPNQRLVPMVQPPGSRPI